MAAKDNARVETQRGVGRHERGRQRMETPGPQPQPGAVEAHGPQSRGGASRADTAGTHGTNRAITAFAAATPPSN